MSNAMSGTMLGRGLLLKSAPRKFFEPTSLSTGETAMLALLPGLVPADLEPLPCGDATVLLEARRLCDEELRWSIIFLC